MTKTILHAGCGSAPLPPWLDGQEVRLDIEPRCKPDIVASLTDLGNIGPFDAIWCSHCLEHLHPDDGDVALKEFERVLQPGGAMLLLVPDMQDIRPTNEPVYESQFGPITGLDMFYGHHKLVKLSPYMAHKTAFVSTTLAEKIARAGFVDIKVNRRAFKYNLFAIGLKEAA